MIKKSLKVTTLLVIIVTFYTWFNYSNSLDFKKDSPLEACWSIQLSDEESGQPIVGVEDIAVDEKTGDVFLSAYDRRAVRDEIANGKVTTEGGFYVFNAALLAGRPQTITPRFLGGPTRPHGFGFDRFIDRNRIVVVDRGYDDGVPALAEPLIEEFKLGPGGLMPKELYTNDKLCSANDVAIYWDGFFVTNDRAECLRKKGMMSDAFGTGGAVYRYQNGEFSVFVDDLDFPNGVAVLRRSQGDLLAVALTKEEEIRLYKISTGELFRIIEVPGAPDNLTVAANGDIYFTMFPNLLDYYFYIDEKLWVKNTPTGVFRIFADSNWFTVQMLYNDDGEMISGATVAARSGDHLIMGSAWDDNIAVCGGMDALGGLEDFEE